MKTDEFKELIEDFVKGNFCVTGCRECHETGSGEIVPEDYKGSYDKAIAQLIDAIGKLWVN